MFVGHYSAAFAARALDSRLPLWTVFVAAQLVDIAWALLVLAGVEKLRVTDGFMAASPLDLYYMPYTHSLLATFVWGAATLLVVRTALRADWRPALLLAAAVVSHWFLDLLVHAPDLPLFDDSYKLGFGLWDRPVLSFVLEIGLLAAAIALYLREQAPAPSMRTAVLVFAGVLVAVQAFNTFGHAVSSATQLVTTALAAFLVFAAVAAWIERRYA